MRRSLFFSGLVAVTLLMGTLGATPGEFPGPWVSGGGIVSATDIEDNVFANAGTFSIDARVSPNGNASGHVNFVFGGAFAAFWGACPSICPGQTAVLHLKGEVTDVETSGGSVVLSGPMSETDIGKHGGNIFYEAEVPNGFTLTLTPGSNTFTLRFCEVPEFQLQVTGGHLSVDGGLPAAPSASSPTAGPRPCATPTR